MTVSSKRAYATCCVTQVCCSQSPCPHSRPLSHVSAGNTKHSKAGLAQSLEGSLGPSEHNVLSEPSKHLWWVWGLILSPVLPLLLFCWGFSFALGRGVSFFLVGANILLSMLVQQQVAVLELLQEKRTLYVLTKHQGPQKGSPDSTPLTICSQFHLLLDFQGHLLGGTLK